LCRHARPTRLQGWKRCTRRWVITWLS
jgi:hypothetical protein